MTPCTSGESRERTEPLGRTDAVPPGSHAVDLGPADFIPPGEGRAYAIGDRTIAVFRQRDGRLFATDNACPHRKGPLADGIVGAGIVICPLHAWRFDLETGRCVSGDAAVIRIYPVQHIDGRVVVWL